MDSEVEDPFIDAQENGGTLSMGLGMSLLLADGTSCTGSTHQTSTSVGGRRSGVSTHSLNEADLQVSQAQLFLFMAPSFGKHHVGNLSHLLQSDFAKVQAKREVESRLMPARLPLQKSVSTPSIIAVRDLASATAQLDGAVQSIQP